MGAGLAHRDDSWDMVYRYGWLAGAVAIGLALSRLDRLIQPGQDGPHWMLALVAAAVLGAVITWSTLSYRVGTAGVLGANLLGLALAAIRIGAPDTAALGLFPTWSTFEVLSEELGFALQLIRYGSAPVVPLSGLILILAVIFWTLGALCAWGLLKGKPAVALVPPLLFYLQLATIDRFRPGLGWPIAALGAVALALLAVGLDERRGAAGRLRRVADGSRVTPVPYLLPAAFIAIPVGLGTLAMSSLGGWVDQAGLVRWRSGAGLGGGIVSGVSYNLFAGIIQEGLVANSETEVFRAEVTGDLDPRQLYFKLINLERFDGENWLPGPSTFRRPIEGRPWGDPSHIQAGDTVRIRQFVTMAALRQNYLPALAQPRDLATAYRIVEDSLRLREDGSLKIDLLTFSGLEYSVISDYAVPDYGALARTGSGNLSPLFDQASQDGVFSPTVPRSSDGVSRPEDLADFLELPDDIDARVRLEARFVTAEGTTPFERAVLLERYFLNTDRQARGFTYSTEAEGHGATDLAQWLFDPFSGNYRTGYCEQFATAMAVMARQIGVPSRVVLGFTPGDVNGNVVIIREKHAHAWVELWMDEHGWVRFDPTPRSDFQNAATTTIGQLGFDPTAHLPPPAVEEETTTALEGPGGTIPSELEILGGEQPPVGPLADLPGGSAISGWLIALVAASAGLGVVPVLKWGRRKRRLRRLQQGDIAAAWEEIVDRLDDLGRPVEPSQTPFEVAEATDASLGPLAREYARVVYGPEGQAEARAISISERSLRDTHTHLTEAHTRGERLWSWMRLRSLR